MEKRESFDSFNRIKTIEAHGNCHIDDFCYDLCKLAKLTDFHITGSFNGIKLTVPPKIMN